MPSSTSTATAANVVAPAFVTAMAAVAGALGATLSLLQLDSVSRRFLSSERLEAKRKAEYKYRWETALMKVMLQNRDMFGFPPDTQFVELLTCIHTSKSISNSAGNTKEDSSSNSDSDQTKLDALVQKLVQPDNNSNNSTETSSNTQMTIVAIEYDENDHRSKRNYFIFFIYGDRKYQVPLVAFGQALAKAMEEKLTSTALCFLADASAGSSSNLLATVLEQSKAGVAVIREPLWMALLANIAKKNVIANSKLERVIFGLARLDAWNVRQQVGAAKTVVFTLPGQASIPVLLPLLQNAFPCERHLFAYDSCFATIQRGIFLRRRKTTKSLLSTIGATTPLSKIPKSASVTSGLTKALSKLPLQYADTAEAWVASIDAFLRMKSGEKITNYLPFVLKLSNITQGSLDDDDDTGGCRLALTNVLQFITGSRSRPLPAGVLDAAVESLRDIREKRSAYIEKNGPLSPIFQAYIEGVAFCHHGILIQNKTLLDTVKPAKEWTLKAAQRISGCLCCDPEEGEDEYEDEQETGKTIGNGVDMSMPGAFAMALSATTSKNQTNNTNKFVDGKSSFAFDPNKFSR